MTKLGIFLDIFTVTSTEIFDFKLQSHTLMSSSRIKPASTRHQGSIKILQGTTGNKPLTLRFPNKRALFDLDLFINSMYSFRPIPSNLKPTEKENLVISSR